MSARLKLKRINDRIQGVMKMAQKALATAEIDRRGKVVQFYGDERVRIDEMMKPCKEAEEALGKWIKEFKPRIRKEAA